YSTVGGAPIRSVRRFRWRRRVSPPPPSRSPEPGPPGRWTRERCCSGCRRGDAESRPLCGLNTSTLHVTHVCYRTCVLQLVRGNRVRQSTRACAQRQCCRPALTREDHGEAHTIEQATARYA